MAKKVDLFNEEDKIRHEKNSIQSSLSFSSVFRAFHLLKRIPLPCNEKLEKFVREGNKLYENKNYTDAAVSYKKALEKNSAYKKATYNMGNALYQDKKFQRKPSPQYQLSAKAADDKSSKAESFHNIGNAHMEGKNYQGAVDAYKNSLRNNPNDDETRYNLAVAQKLLDKQNQQNKDKNKNKNNKNNKDDKNKDKDKKEGDDKDKKDPKDKNDKGDQNKDKKNQDPDKKDKKKQKPKPQQGKMTPEQIKQLLESLNNEERKLKRS